MTGKGDKDRTVDRKAYENNWDNIFTDKYRVKNDAQLAHEQKVFGNIEVITPTKRILIERAMEELNDEYPQTLKSLSQHRSDGADLDRYKADTKQITGEGK